MKFKDYLNSLVSKRKNNTSSTKSHSKSSPTNNHQDLTPSTDSHYDIYGYEDINSIVSDDPHTRTQILLARHAELVNTIVGTRSLYDNTLSSSAQCRISQQPLSTNPPPLPPPLPPKLPLEQQASFSNRRFSSTLATCSPRRECQHHHHHQKQEQQQQQQQQPQQYHPVHLTSLQYSTPNASVMSSSSSSLWGTTTSLSIKQRSRIRTNPWIGNNLANNRSSTFVEPSHICCHQISSRIPPTSQPEYGIYDPTCHTSPSLLIHSESFPHTTSNGNNNLTNSPSPPLAPALPPPPVPTSSIILHQSDSGHGFSLASSRVIDSLPSSSSSSSSSSASTTSSSPCPSNSSSANITGDDGMLLNEKQLHRSKKLKKKIPSTKSPLVLRKSPKPNINTEQYFCPVKVTSDSDSLTQRTKVSQIPSTVPYQYRSQPTSNTTRTGLLKLPVDRIHHEHYSSSSSSRSIDDHFSLEFEEILENERSYKQRKDKKPSTQLISPTSVSSRKNPFILPLDDTTMKLPTPPPILFSPTLTKTNSRAILKHIEEIENEIQLIKNLDLAHNRNNNNNDDDNDDDDDDDNEYILSPHAYPEDINLEDESNHENDDDDTEEVIKDKRQSINEQVDQWVERCLKTTNNTDNSATLLHAECNHLSNTIKDYVVCVCSNNDRRIPSIPTSSIPSKTRKLMTAFYLSSIPNSTAKRTSSFIVEPSKLEKSQTIVRHLQPIHECPF